MAEIGLLNSEGRYRMLFEQSLLGLAVEDFSSAKVLVNQLEQGGGEDLYQYSYDNPEIFGDAIAATRTTHVNEVMLEIYEANSWEY
jgi:hypothetical protein